LKIIYKISLYIFSQNKLSSSEFKNSSSSFYEISILDSFIIDFKFSNKLSFHVNILVMLS